MNLRVFVLGFSAGVLITTIIFFAVLSGLSDIAGIIDSIYGTVHSDEYAKLETVSSTLTLLRLNIESLHDRYNAIAGTLGITTVTLIALSALLLAISIVLIVKKKQ